VIVFGVGGVGSWCAEGLIRSGVGTLTIVDSDCVSITNVNRQLMATTKTVGKPKVDVLRERLLEINPNATINAIQDVYCAENATSFHLDEYDYVIDAIDSLKDKAHLILEATMSNAKLFASMGAALKLDPMKIKVAEFWDVKGCPLGAALRKKFKKEKLFPKRKFKCVYSEELLENLGNEPEIDSTNTWDAKKAQINGSLVHITAIFGFTLSGLVVQDIYDKIHKQK
jgi:tRNA A37 threonylcarbamoyladenosine dehydratase